MQIAPGVRLTPSADLTFTGTYPPNVYLIGNTKAAFIDAGYGNAASVRARLEYARAQGYDKLEYILVTHSHPDHLGGAAKIAEPMGARILLHPADAKKETQAIVEGSTIELGEYTLSVIHTPGHSPGSVCFFMQPGAVLFSGDTILGLGTTVVVPPGGNMLDYLASLNRMAGLNAAVICPGHGPVIKEPARKIAELIEHRLEREKQVLGAIGRGSSTVDMLIADIYPELEKKLFYLARWQVIAEIDKLVKEGKVAAAGENSYRLS